MHSCLAQKRESIAGMLPINPLISLVYSVNQLDDTPNSLGCRNLAWNCGLSYVRHVLLHVNGMEANKIESLRKCMVKLGYSCRGHGG